MRSYYEHSDPGNSFQRSRNERPERQGPQNGGVSDISALPLLNGVESVVRQGVDWVSRWRQRRTAIREIQTLNDHYLKDIGLDRSQIVSSVEEIIKTGSRTLPGRPRGQ